MFVANTEDQEQADYTEMLMSALLVRLLHKETQHVRVELIFDTVRMEEQAFGPQVREVYG